MEPSKRDRGDRNVRAESFREHGDQLDRHTLAETLQNGQEDKNIDFAPV
ncbi:hypothetical protein H6F67_02665 [Microcoleus sp. FACHB-1515]|nr:hypothetical protein [Microcoleus sp. FACHB-1515]MBD2088765.1 hypothetical protein [Microcoleus sp. FACHB-1515]